MLVANQQANTGEPPSDEFGELRDEVSDTSFPCDEVSDTLFPCDEVSDTSFRHLVSV